MRLSVKGRINLGMKPRKFYLLASPVYVSAVLLLLLNDFVLKRSYPGWLTGKLSAFAGLFAFSVFALILLPRRLSIVSLALAFALWKTPFSEPLISWWDSMALWPAGRTVDYTDLFAITIIPLAWIFHQHAKTEHIRLGWCLLSCCISLFAFCATTKAPTPEQQAAFAAAVEEYKFTGDEPSYLLSLNRKELYRRIEALGFVVSGGTEVYPDFNKHTAYIFPRPLAPLRAQLSSTKSPAR